MGVTAQGPPGHGPWVLGTASGPSYEYVNFMLFATCVANLAKCTLPDFALLAETQGKGVFLLLFVTVWLHFRHRKVTRKRLKT